MVPRLSVSLSIMFLLGLLITCCDLLVPGVSQSATTVKSKKEMKPPLDQPLVSDKSAPTTGRGLEGKKPPMPASDKTMSAKAKKPSSSGRTPKKSSRHRKSKAKPQPTAPVESQPDVAMNLAHYGILERPRRYDPGYDRRAASVLNPMGRELLCDHFLELDRNHDGAIDPFERAGSRLDIDRDLHNRPWE